MIKLVERLNTEYDVQNISSREAAEQALDRLTVSVLAVYQVFTLKLLFSLGCESETRQLDSVASLSQVMLATLPSFFFFNTMDHLDHTTVSTLTLFYFNYQNPLVSRFLVQIWAIVISTSTGLTNLHLLPFINRK